MTSGDAYLVAVVVKDHNVAEIGQEMKLCHDFHEMISEVVNEKSDGAPTSMRRWYFYDMLINKNYPWNDGRFDELICDNLALDYVSDDSWSKSYHAVGKVGMMNVGKFIKRFKNKAWINPKMNQFAKNTLVIVPSHYDVTEEFLEDFKVKKFPKENQ